MQLDTIDWEIVRLLSNDGRATYSEISKVVGVSIGTVRNRVTALRESGALHLNVWLDPYKVGLGITSTFLIKVQAGHFDAVIETITDLDSTGYVAVIAGDHDLMVDVFCRDVQHLNRVLRDEIHSIDGVLSVTSYLVTEVRYESSANMASLLEGGAEPAQPSDAGERNSRRSRTA